MSDEAAATPTKPEPSYRQILGNAESSEAIGEVIATARTTLRVFDFRLGHRGFNSPKRSEALFNFLVAGPRTHRLLIALHEPETVVKECPRLIMLLRQFPMSIEINRTLDEARKAMDPFVVADDHSVWHQQHYEQPRAIVALHSPADAMPIVERFDEIWAWSEQAISPTTLGL